MNIRILMILFFVAIWAPAPAAADTLLARGTEVTCTVRSILGTNKSAEGIDKRLAFIRAQLSKPPFSAFKTKKLISSSVLKIAKGQKQKTRLPSGKTLALRFKEEVLTGKKNQMRLRMELEISSKAKGRGTSTVFSIVNGGTLLVAGDKFRGGTLVVGITCKD